MDKMDKIALGLVLCLTSLLVYSGVSNYFFVKKANIYYNILDDGIKSGNIVYLNKVYSVKEIK